MDLKTIKLLDKLWLSARIPCLFCRYIIIISVAKVRYSFHSKYK